MTLPEALDLVVARTSHERYRWLCSDDNPDAAQREAFRRYVIEQASGELERLPTKAALKVDYGNQPAPPPFRGSCCG